MAGGIQITGTGHRIVRSDGTVVRTIVPTAPCGCVDCNGNCIGLGCKKDCTDHATCNKYCNSQIADFEQGENCRCPCEGRRGYPPAYEIAINNVGLDTLSKFYLGDPSTDDYIKINTSGPFQFIWRTDCGWVEPPPSTTEGLPDGAYFVSYTQYHHDDTVVATITDATISVQSIGFGGDAVHMNPGNCGISNAPDPTKMYPSTLIGLSFSGNGEAYDVLNLVFNGGSIFGFDSTNDVPLDRCVASSASLYVISQTFNDWAAWQPFADTGTIKIAPLCDDCDGIEYDRSNDVTAAVCAFEYDVVVTLPDDSGGTDRTHTYRLFKNDSATWYGSDQYVNAAYIMNTTTATMNLLPFPDDLTYLKPSECCDKPGCKCSHDDADTFDSFPGCPQCWTLTLLWIDPTVGFTFTKAFGTGSCPAGFTAFQFGPDGTGPQPSISGGFLTGCNGTDCDCCKDPESEDILSLSDVIAATVTLSGVTACPCDGPGPISNPFDGSGCDPGYAKLDTLSVLDGTYTLIKSTLPQFGGGVGFQWSGYVLPASRMYSDKFCHDEETLPNAGGGSVSSKESFTTISMWCNNGLWTLIAGRGYNGPNNFPYLAACVRGSGGTMFYATATCVDGLDGLQFNGRVCVPGCLSGAGNATVAFT